MKYSQQLAIVAALAGVANAQSTCLATAEQIPACALGYIASYAFFQDGCGLVDFACQCSHTQDIEQGIVASLSSDCNAGSVLNSAAALCSCATANAGQSVSLNAIESQCQTSAANIPACALGYLAEGAYSVASCQLNDFECQCANSATIAGAIEASVSSACGGVSDVLNSVSALCACVSGSGSSGPTGSPSATTTGTGSSPTGTGSSSASPSGSSKSGATSTGSKASGTGTATGSSKPTGTGSSSKSSTGGSTGSMAIPTFTGAGATATAFGGLFGVVAGLAAFL